MVAILVKLKFLPAKPLLIRAEISHGACLRGRKGTHEKRQRQCQRRVSARHVPDSEPSDFAGRCKLLPIVTLVGRKVAGFFIWVKRHNVFRIGLKKIWHRHSCLCIYPSDSIQSPGKSACATESSGLFKPSQLTYALLRNSPLIAQIPNNGPNAMLARAQFHP
jgi:hypothetical protein